SVATGLRPVGPGQRPGPTPNPSVRVRDPDPHRTHTEIWADNSVATGLRPVGPGQRPGPTPNPSVRVRDPDPHPDSPTPGPTQRSRIIYSGLPPAIEGTSSTSSPSWKA